MREKGHRNKVGRKPKRIVGENKRMLEIEIPMGKYWKYRILRFYLRN